MTRKNASRDAEIVRRRQQGETQTALAKEFGLTRARVSEIVLTYDQVIARDEARSARAEARSARAHLALKLSLDARVARRAKSLLAMKEAVEEARRLLAKAIGELEPLGSVTLPIMRGFDARAFVQEESQRQGGIFYCKRVAGGVKIDRLK